MADGSRPRAARHPRLTRAVPHAVHWLASERELPSAGLMRIRIRPRTAAAFATMTRRAILASNRRTHPRRLLRVIRAAGRERERVAAPARSDRCGGGTGPRSTDGTTPSSTWAVSGGEPRTARCDVCQPSKQPTTTSTRAARRRRPQSSHATHPRFAYQLISPTGCGMPLRTRILDLADSPVSVDAASVLARC